MYATRSGFSLLVHKAMLPKTLTKTDATPYTASASHVHALGLPQGPIYLPLGNNPFILSDANNDGDAYNA